VASLVNVQIVSPVSKVETSFFFYSNYFTLLIGYYKLTIKGPRCFLEQETLLLSTGWFQEQIRA